MTTYALSRSGRLHTAECPTLQTPQSMVVTDQYDSLPQPLTDDEARGLAARRPRCKTCAPAFLDDSDRQDTPRPVFLPLPGEAPPVRPKAGEEPPNNAEDSPAMPDQLDAYQPPEVPDAPEKAVDVQPQPITPEDRSDVAGAALASAAGQLRVDAQDGPSSPELVGVPWRHLIAVSRWLDARAGLYGVTPEATGWGFGR